MIKRIQIGELWLIAVMAAAGLGLLIVRSPHAAYAAVALVSVWAVLMSGAARLPATYVFAAAIVLTSALVDLPNRLDVGRFSANAYLTAAYAIAGLLAVALWRQTAGGATMPVTPFVALFVFALASITWGAPSVAALQNLLVLLVFIVCIFCGARIAMHEDSPGQFAARVLGIGSSVALFLYAASVATGGLGSGTVIGGRTYALFALLSIAWGVAGWRYGARFGRTLTVLSALLLLLSLSRTAFVAALAISSVAWFNPRSVGGWVRSIAAFGAAAAIGYLAVNHIDALHERVYAGDVRPIGGGISINLAGRSEFWATTWHSYLTSPYVGHGVGTADGLITRAYGAVAHPHNDYLRVLHDYGLLGICLWAVGYCWLLRRSWRAWQRPSPTADNERRIHAAAFLSLVAVALAMVTDNVVIYLYVMGPLGLLVGTSLGIETRRVAAEAELGRNSEADPTRPALPAATRLRGTPREDAGAWTW